MGAVMPQRVRNLKVRRDWWAKNKDKENKKRRDETGDKREVKKARNRAWHANMTPTQRAGWDAYMYSYGLRLRFKISLVKWLSIFHTQGERCACCHTTVPGRKRWHTDHDHETGVVRGIVCCKCNTVLGQLGDRIDRVEDSCTMYVGYLKGAEPRWARGGKAAADENDRLVRWEP